MGRDAVARNADVLDAPVHLCFNEGAQAKHQPHNTHRHHDDSSGGQIGSFHSGFSSLALCGHAAPTACGTVIKVFCQRGVCGR